MTSDGKTTELNILYTGCFCILWFIICNVSQTHLSKTPNKVKNHTNDCNLMQSRLNIVSAAFEQITLNTAFDREYGPLLPSPATAADTAAMEKYQQGWPDTLAVYTHLPLGWEQSKTDYDWQ